MFTVFVTKQSPETIYITRPDYFSRFLSDMQIEQADVVWHNVSLEALMLLKENQSNYLVLAK